MTDRFNIYNVEGTGINYRDAVDDSGSGANGNIRKGSWYSWNVTLTDGTTEANRGSLYKFIEAHVSIIDTTGLAPLEEKCCRWFCSGTSDAELLEYLKRVEAQLTPIAMATLSANGTKSWARLQGEVDYQAKKCQHAALHFETVKDQDAQFTRGCSFFLAGQESRGEKILKKVGTPDAFNTLGQLHYHNNPRDLGKALGFYLNAAEGGILSAYEGAALCHDALNHPVQAHLMRLKKAMIEANIPCSQAVGKAAFEAEEYYNAIAHLDRLDDQESLFMVGVSYVQLNDPRALAYLQKANDKGHIDALAWVGHWHYQRGEFDQAYEHYNRGRHASTEALRGCIKCIEEGKVTEEPTILIQRKALLQAKLSGLI